MIYLLLGITIAFMVANLVLADYDYMHPSFLFCLVFFVYTLVCTICQNTYAITLHFATVAVVTTGLGVFTLVGMISRSLRARSKESTLAYTRSYQPIRQAGTGGNLKKIEIRNLFVLLLLAMQVITILTFIGYLRELTVVFNTTERAAVEGMVSTSDLSAQINFYDTLTKFWSDTFDEMNVAVPMIYRLGNPLTSAAAYLMIYVCVHNFVVDRSINPLHIAVVGLQCVLIVLNGSRSPLFRILTMVLILFYVLTVRYGRRRSGDRRFLLRMVLLILAAGAGFVILLNIMGRTDAASAKVGNYLFIYLGAPLVNLDTYLTTSVVGLKEGLIGAQTFKALYAYLGKIFSIEAFNYKAVGGFAFSSNGIEIGNVYTMFYKIIYDFGYGGVVPLTLLMSCYYVFTYDHITHGHIRPEPISFGLFIYAYLFNDLLMSAFSARFYETTLEAPFIKLFIVSLLYVIVLFRRSLHLGRYRVLLTAADYRGIHRRFVAVNRQTPEIH